MQSTCLRLPLPANTCHVLYRRTNLLCKTLPRRAIQSSPMSVVSEWKGIENWRAAPIDERRSWGKSAPMLEEATRLGKRVASILAAETAPITTREKGVPPLSSGTADDGTVEQLHGLGFDCDSLASWGVLVLEMPDPLAKARLTHQAYCMWRNGQLKLGVDSAPNKPGRPPKPELVPPRQVPPPKDTSLSPSAHLLHNLAHIELNAIDLAWDTVVRFSSASEELGQEFFNDFLHVADDESRHFRWCSQRLNELGFSYGDMPAHNLLWEDCMKTSGSVKSRLAVIPMMQEARGLDAGPRLVKKLLGLNDHRSAAIVRRIGQEEVAHVSVGVFHFLRICEKLRVEPGDEFKEVMSEFNVQLHGPFNHQARQLAGLQRHWYDGVESNESGKFRGNLQTTNEAINKKILSMGAKTPWVAPSPTQEYTKEETSNTNSHTNASGSKDASESKEDSISKKSDGNTSKNTLNEVFERLALLVAMEKNNAGI